MPAEKKSVVIKAEVKKHEKPNAEKRRQSTGLEIE